VGDAHIILAVVSVVAVGTAVVIMDAWVVVFNYQPVVMRLTKALNGNF
jgi:hypothetical protein